MSQQIHLEGFNATVELERWKQQGWHWALSHWEKDCHVVLMWRIDSKYGHIEKFAKTPEEVVFLALEEFKLWEKSC